jgi:AraC-like DNA-binding protein
MNTHIGSDYDSLLSAEGILEETTTAAIKRVIAWQIKEEMHAQHLTKTAMAARMHTSRSTLNRLLDEQDTSLMVRTLVRAAEAVGKKLSLS